MKENKQVCIHRRDFVAELAEKLDMSEAVAEQFTEAFLEQLAQHWSEKESVCFKGFGTFEIRPTSERLARNPATMEDVMIPAGHKPVFKASKRLRAAVNQNINKKEAL